MTTVANVQTWDDHEQERIQAWAKYEEERALAWAEYQKALVQAWAKYETMCNKIESDQALLIAGLKQLAETSA